MKATVERHALVSYYIVTLIFSAVIMLLLFATGMAESLFFLGTFTPGLAAIFVTALIGSERAVRRLLGSLLMQTA